VLPDEPGLHAALTHPDQRPTPELRPVLDRLVADGWVVDAAAEDRARRAARRHRPPVALDADPTLAAALARACTAAQLDVDPAAGVRVVMTAGEPRRSVSDGLVRDDVPHLWVSVHARMVRIGPFVEPGRSPCLRCVDAHLGEVDPRRATVLHQLEDHSHALAAEPDPLLVTIAASAAVRDVVRRLDGEAPAFRAADLAASPPLRLRLGLSHHHSLSSLPSIARRWSREQESQ
jgi:hypothetical protein